MVRTVAGRLVPSGRIGLLPSAYNPPTVAHLALAAGAQEAFALDQVVHVLPASMPHKRVERPSARERLDWLARLAGGRKDRAVASCPTGLIIDIVRAFRDELGSRCEFHVIAGRDAAERYESWDYGDGAPFADQLRQFKLLVAARGSSFRIAPEFKGLVLPFKIERRFSSVSSQLVREAVRAGGEWREMVPREIREAVSRAYREDRL